MLHNEARNLLVKAYEKTRDAKAVALAYGVSEKKKMLHASEQERPRCAGQERTMEWVCEDDTH